MASATKSARLAGNSGTPCVTTVLVVVVEDVELVVDVDEVPVEDVEDVELVVDVDEVPVEDVKDVELVVDVDEVPVLVLVVVVDGCNISRVLSRA